MGSETTNDRYADEYMNMQLGEMDHWMHEDMHEWTHRWSNSSTPWSQYCDRCRVWWNWWRLRAQYLIGRKGSRFRCPDLNLNLERQKMKWAIGYRMLLCVMTIELCRTFVTCTGNWMEPIWSDSTNNESSTLISQFESWFTIKGHELHF